jgi:hypothetical protein
VAEKIIDNDSFFALLDDLDRDNLSRTKGDFPWENQAYGQDCGAAEDAVRAFYDHLKLPKPRIAWASSPASLWRAVTMLRGYAMKAQFVDALVPKNGGVEEEAKRTLLNAILDTDLLTSTGAPLASILCWNHWKTPPRVYKAIDDVDRLLTAAARFGQPQRAATFSDAVLYPLLYSEGHSKLAANAFCILPYAKVCWLCLPPMFLKTDFNGRLHCDYGLAIAWADGYAINRVQEYPKELAAGDKTLAIEGQVQEAIAKALPAPEGKP